MASGRLDLEQRFALLAATAVGGFLLVVLGLLRLQVVQYDKYRRLSEENRVRLEVLPAPRGAIFDRNGELLADSYPSFNIVFRPVPAESTQRARLVIDREIQGHQGEGSSYRFHSTYTEQIVD
jgi:penicillin-binding protein 2